MVFHDMTYDEWVLRFKPLMDSEGHPQMFDTIDRGVDAQFIWTNMESDDGTDSGMVPGIVRVNRNYHVVCTVPYVGDQGWVSLNER